MPDWLLNMLAIDGDFSVQVGSVDSMSASDLRRENEMWKARAKHLLGQLNLKSEQLSTMKESLAGAKRKYNSLLSEKDKEINMLKESNASLEAEVKRLQQKLEEL